MQNILKSITLLSFILLTHLGIAQVQNVKSPEFNTMMSKEKVQILDVRTPEEYADGHLAKALNVNYFDKTFSEQVKTLDKKKTVLVYCAVGGRSSKAADLLNKMGYKTVNLVGGINDWKAQGLPISK